MKKFLTLFTLLMLCGYLQARTFTNAKGQTIEASVVSLSEDKVELKLDKGGKLVTYPILKLSKADREYLKVWQGKKEVAPAASTSRGFSSSALKERYKLKDNYDAEWPKLVKVDIGLPIEIVEEDKKAGKFVYHSPNYEFICDVGLSKNVVKKFAVLFEATREYCRLLPISTMKAHVPGAKFRHRILLFESMQTYIENGGPPWSSGVFMMRGGSGVVMAPLTSLGVKKVGSSFMYNYKGTNNVLPHELVHQLTDLAYYEVGARGWFSEGLAEYVAVTPYRSGKFMVRSNLSAIKAFATEFGKKGRGGRAMGTDIIAPSLKKYMLQSYGSFVEKANFNYGLGMLLTYYFFHMEDDRSNIVAFMKALKEGKRGEESLTALLNGRSFEELEKQISKAWKSRGIRIRFN